MSDQPQAIIVYRNQYEYAMQNDPNVQDAWVTFMFWVIVAISLYCGYYWLKGKFGNKVNRFKNRNNNRRGMF